MRTLSWRNSLNRPFWTLFTIFPGMGGSAEETTKGIAVHGTTEPRAGRWGLTAGLLERGPTSRAMFQGVNHAEWLAEGADTAPLPPPGRRGVLLMAEAWHRSLYMGYALNILVVLTCGGFVARTFSGLPDLCYLPIFGGHGHWWASLCGDAPLKRSSIRGNYDAFHIDINVMVSAGVRGHDPLWPRAQILPRFLLPAEEGYHLWRRHRWRIPCTYGGGAAPPLGQYLLSWWRGCEPLSPLSESRNSTTTQLSWTLKFL